MEFFVTFYDLWLILLVDQFETLRVQISFAPKWYIAIATSIVSKSSNLKNGLFETQKDNNFLPPGHDDDNAYYYY